MIEPWNRSKTEPNGGFRVEPLALDNPYYRSLRAERQDFALSVVTPSRRTY